MRDGIFSMKWRLKSSQSLLVNPDKIVRICSAVWERIEPFPIDSKTTAVCTQLWSNRMELRWRADARSGQEYL